MALVFENTCLTTGEGGGALIYLQVGPKTANGVVTSIMNYDKLIRKLTWFVFQFQSNSVTQSWKRRGILPCPI